MMMMFMCSRNFFAFFSFIVVFFFLLSPARAGVFNAETVTLKNGLQIIAIPNHKAPVVHHIIWYKVGAADEKLGKSGLAHFFEHLMFRGTETLADGEFSKTISALGGVNNAFTGLDYTAYHQTIAREHLETVMKMEADRMQNLMLTDEVIETERQVVLEERRQRLENSPFARYSERENGILYGQHPYAVPTIGWSHEIETLSHDDIRGFYRQWYRPSNAVVVVSGDIVLDDLKVLAEKTYGTIESRPYLAREKRPAIPRNITENLISEIHFKDANIRRPYYRLSFLVPSESMNNRTATILGLITEVLAGGQSSLLYQSLVTEKEIATSAGVSYFSEIEDWGSLTFYAVLKNEKDFKVAQKAIHDVVSNLVQNGISQETLEQIKKRFMASAVYARDSLEGPARIVGEAVSLGLSIEDVETWPDLLTSITVEEVNKILRHWFDFEKSENFIVPPVEGFLTPEKEESQ